MASTKNRSSNIELLRIIAAIGVFFLHYNNQYMGNAFSYAKGINLYFLFFLEGLFCCAVNLFILITGYFSCYNAKVDLWNPFSLLINVVFVSITYYFVSVFIMGNEFSIKALISAFVPNNYFIVLYCALIVLSPFINKLLENLTEQQLKLLVIVLISLFSIWSFCVDISTVYFGEWYGLSTVGVSGAQDGYTIVNFFMMYVIGAYLRKRSNKGITNSSRIVLLVVSAALLGFLGYLDLKVIWIKPVWSYFNPLIILNAILWFEIFVNIKKLKSKVINTLAKSSLMMYLVHGYFLNYLNIKDFASSNVFLMFLHLLISAILLYVFSFVVYLIYRFFFLRILMKFKKVVKVPDFFISLGS